jgi:hypothetical protein
MEDINIEALEKRSETELRNIVVDNVYYNNYGDGIEFNQLIRLHFAGSPNWKLPVTLMTGFNYLSTVSYKNEVTLIVKDSSGKLFLFDFVRHYNPKPEDRF